MIDDHSASSRIPLQTKLFSVIIPVYNSEKIISQTVQRCLGFFSVSKRSCEIILVNDGSKDNSWSVISHLALQHKNIVAINLLHNYGQHTANLCGFQNAKGDYLITLDDDLQNPPEEIEVLIEKASEGYDFVVGRFKTKEHSWERRLGSIVMQWLNRKIFNTPKDFVHTNFRLIEREVIKRVLAYHTHYPYTSGLCAMFSNRQTNVLIEHREREVGKSNYTLKKLFALAFNIVFHYSRIPMQILTFVGLSVAAISFLISVYYLIRGLFFDPSVPGWASITFLLSTLNGVILFLLSLIGEYVGRIMRQISQPDTYHIKSIVK